MRFEEHIAALRREGELLATSVERTDLDAIPPTCPDWTVRELTHHLGRVHRWAATYVRDGRAAPLSPDEAELAWGEMPDDRDLVSWFRDGHRALVDALVAAPADVACWSFLPASSPLAFWARRQAHETAVHRADAQSAGGMVDGVDRDFAVDGVDELLLCFYSRPGNRLRTDAARVLAVTASDADATWLVHMGPEGARAERGDGPADARVTAPASDLYLGLWNRVPLAATEGDPDLIDLWHEKARVTWS